MKELLSGPKVVGVKQTRRAVAAGRAKKVYLACDADPMLLEPLRTACTLGDIEMEEGLTMAQLGKACAIAVGTASCAILGE